METWLFVGRLVLTGLLYLFLIAVFIVLWRDVRAAIPVGAPAAPEASGRLVVLEGNAELATGAVLSLRPFTTLGRGASNTLVLPDTFASAEHAVITLRGGQWWLEDRGSRNGTMVNELPIESPVVLSAGDVIGIGRIKLKVESGK